MANTSKITLSNLSSLQLDSVLYKLQLTAPTSYDEDGKLGLLRCSKIFNRGIGDLNEDEILAVFSKKGTFIDFESTDGRLRGIFTKSSDDKIMYPCSVCAKEVTDRSDTSGYGLECGGCGWFFHSNCTDKPISIELFKALKNSPNYVKVLCPPCNTVYGSAHNKLKRVEQKLAKLTDKVNNVDTKIEKVSKSPLYSQVAGSSGKHKHDKSLSQPLSPHLVNGLKSITKAAQDNENTERLKRTRVVIKPEDTNIRTSRDIRRAFNKHYQGVIIKHCRLTASGSITFEFDDETIAKSVQNEWSLEYFGGNKGMKIPGDFNTVGMVKHVYDDFTEQDIKQDILNNYPGDIKKCEFQKRKSDQSFNGMIKIEFASREALLKVVSDRIKFCNQRYIVEEYKRKGKVVKCGNCQGWGHVHRYCTKPAKCGKCAEKHETRTCTITSGYKCAHCGKGHVAGSFDCDVYKEKVAKFSHDSK
jgi:hypothetical protein